MLPAGHRLRRRQDFTTALRRGRRAGRPLLVAHLECLEPGLAADAPPRVGFVVSRAVGGAVVRNAVRRRLRHVARERLPHLPPGSRLVVRALPAAVDASSGALGADLDAALARLLRPRPAAMQSQGGPS